jgi:hypothetical protein
MPSEIIAVTSATEAPAVPPPTATENHKPAATHTAPPRRPDTVSLSLAAKAELAAEQLAHDTPAQLAALAASGDIAAQQLLAQEAAEAKQATPLPKSLP